MIFYDFFVELGKMKDFLVNSIRKNKKNLPFDVKKNFLRICQKVTPMPMLGAPCFQMGKFSDF